MLIVIHNKQQLLQKTQENGLAVFLYTMVHEMWTDDFKQVVYFQKRTRCLLISFIQIT